MENKTNRSNDASWTAVNSLLRAARGKTSLRTSYKLGMESYIPIGGAGKRKAGNSRTALDGNLVT